MLMCELSRRALGVGPTEKRVDWETCMLYCGKGHTVDLRAPPPSRDSGSLVGGGGAPSAEVALGAATAAGAAGAASAGAVGRLLAAD